MNHWSEQEFDQYLMNRMDDRTRQSFEQALAADAGLAADFGQYSRIVVLLQQRRTRMQMKKQLRSVQERMNLEIKAGGLGKRLNLFQVWNLAAAASVAALITLSLFFLSGKLGFKNNDAYLELRNEVKDIYSEQEHIKRELSKDSRKPVIYTGTSFAVSSDGYLATNYHVIRDLDSVWVSNFTDSLVKFTAIIIYKSAEQDIALLKITDPSFRGFGRLPYSRPAKGADIGEYVFTLGYSKQDIVFGEGSVSSVSGFNSDTTAYQVSIPVNPGNSGGPLFDSNGNLLGMISGKNTHKDGVGFALKSDYIFEAMDQIAHSEQAPHPVIQMKNRIGNKKRTEQIKILQPLVFKVQVAK